MGTNDYFNIVEFIFSKIMAVYTALNEIKIVGNLSLWQLFIAITILDMCITFYLKVLNAEDMARIGERIREKRSKGKE